jgi:integrase
VAEAEKLIASVNQDAVTMHRLWRDLHESIALNPGYTMEVSLVIFIIDIHIQSIKASSALTYTYLILEASRRAGTPISGPLVGDLVKALKLLASEDETRHAPDITEDEAWALLLSLPEGELRLTFFFLLVFGMRAADAIRIFCGDILLESDGHVTIYFRITKNHRNAKERYAVRIRPRLLIPELSRVFSAPTGSRIPILDCGKFNEQISAHKLITTYSLRRCFIHTAITSHTVAGITDWIACARLTGHHDLAVLRSSYAPRFKGTL